MTTQRVKTLHQFRKTKKSDDFFPTEPRFVDALLAHEKFRGKIFEPACGEGDISDRLRLRSHSVVSSDLFDRGYGQVGRDFLKSKRIIDNIVTNPPFILFDAFFHQAWKLAKHKIAFVSGLPNLASSQSRARAIWMQFPPTKIIVCLNKMFVRGSGTSIFNHCWIVWDKKSKIKTTQFVWHIFEKGQE